MADFVATGETTSTTRTAPTVTFSDKTEVFCSEDLKEKVPAPIRPTMSKNRRQRRNNAIAQQKAKEDAKIKSQENVEIIKKYTDQLTLKKLVAEVKQYKTKGMEELGIKKLIGGVPNNGQVLYSPTSYCSDCVNMIAAYFKDENMARNILKNDDDDDGVEVQVYIKDVKKLATLFLDAQKLHFYDHVKVEAFNDNAMKRGGSTYGVPLSMACLADAAENGGGSGNLYEKLAGKETVCAAFSTGVAMQSETSELTAFSGNCFKTHKQLLEENVDLNTIRNGCLCLKSDEWLMKRATVERRMERLIEKKENEAENEKEGESEEKETNEVDSDEEEKAEKNSKEEEKEDDEDSVVIFEQPENVDDYDFRPGNLVQPVEKEEDFDNERWSEMRTTSSCLALCRHSSSCVVNAINKARVLKSLMLDRVPKDEKKGIASTTPGEYFTVIPHPKSYLIFSLGATVYEALARQYDDDDLLGNNVSTSWPSVINNKSDGNGEKVGLASIQSSKKIIAKVYITVHTVAAPFSRSAPVCYINQQNKYGNIKTFRIRIPGNFSGYYNDTSIGWRSELYSRIVVSAAEDECRGDKKSHYPFLEEDQDSFDAWPRRKPIIVEGGIVYDDSGDMSGNYLTFMDGIEKEEKTEKTAVTAYANMRHLTTAIKSLNESIGELLTGPFKTQLVELKTLDIDRTQAEEAAAAAGGLSAHETQILNDFRTELTQNAIIRAMSIEEYEKCLKSLERDVGTMNKYLSSNLKGYTAIAAASHKYDVHENFYAYYL
uniref:Wsv260-like protein n=1 Tax=Metopaulias depressus WSSV-like virus TaxID=1675544 RepID=A0A0K0VL89_9VIRU|nr:wsv260-like protein [Metopaulias depressus WSSV-like virus]